MHRRQRGLGVHSKNFKDMQGIRLEDAVYAASTALARVIGAEKAGSIEVGHSADLVVLDEQLQVKAVYVDGERAEV